MWPYMHYTESKLKCAALAFIDFCEIIKFLHVYVCVVGGSCLIILWVTFVLPVCVAPPPPPRPRQTNVTPGLLFTGDSRRRRETDAVSVATSGNTLHTYWWISGLLIIVGGVLLLLNTRLNLQIQNVTYLKERLFWWYKKLCSFLCLDMLAACLNY